MHRIDNIIAASTTTGRGFETRTCAYFKWSRSGTRNVAQISSISGAIPLQQPRKTEPKHNDELARIACPSCISQDQPHSITHETALVVVAGPYHPPPGILPAHLHRHRCYPP